MVSVLSRSLPSTLHAVLNRFLSVNLDSALDSRPGCSDATNGCSGEAPRAKRAARHAATPASFPPSRHNGTFRDRPLFGASCANTDVGPRHLAPDVGQLKLHNLAAP